MSEEKAAVLMVDMIIDPIDGRFVRLDEATAEQLRPIVRYLGKALECSQKAHESTLLLWKLERGR